MRICNYQQQLRNSYQGGRTTVGPTQRKTDFNPSPNVSCPKTVKPKIPVLWLMILSVIQGFKLEVMGSPPPVRTLKMAAGFLSEHFTSCVLTHPVKSELTTTAAGWSLLSHTAAETQDSLLLKNTPTHTVKLTQLHRIIKLK